MKDLFKYFTDHLDYFISLIALIVAVFTLLSQRRHDRMTLKPLAAIIIQDFDEYFKIKVKNAGVGPLIITGVVTENGSGGKMGYPIDWFENQKYLWDNFNKPSDEKILAVGDELVLLHYGIGRIDDQSKSQRKLDIKTLRQILKEFKISISYKDIYGKQQPVSVRDLSWFGRPNRI